MNQGPHSFQSSGSETFSPSDLLDDSVIAGLKGEGCVCAGRIAAVSSAAFVLADALGALTVAFQDSAAAGLSPGDLLLCQVRRQKKSDRAGWRLEEVQNHWPCPEPNGAGHFVRYHGRGRFLEARSRAYALVRAHFAEMRFLEVETPSFVPCPGLDEHVDSLAEVTLGARTYHLITSPELHMKRLLVAGVPRIYQLARCYRREELGALHEPEFTMLEWYRSFSDMAQMMRETELIVRKVYAGLSTPEVCERLGAAAFARVTVEQAFAKYALRDDAVLLAEQDPAQFFQLLVDEVEPGLQSLGAPVFLTHFPRAMAALARPCPSDPRLAERFELYIEGVELCNGYGELTDSALTRQRFEQELGRRRDEGAREYPIDEQFLAALREGLPPCSGNALGMDRLIALCLDLDQIGPTFAFRHDER